MGRVAVVSAALPGVLLVALAIGGCSGGAGETTSTSSSTTLGSSSTSSTTTSSTTTTTTTTSTTLPPDEAVIAIDPPDSWTEVGPASYQLPAIAGGLAPTMVTIESMGPEDLDAVFTEAKAALSEIVREFEVLSEGERDVGRYPARFLEYAGVDQGNIARYEVWIDRNGVTVHVTYSASVEAYTAGKAEFEETIVSSIG